MVTDVVIPVKDQLHYTRSVVEQLQEMDGWTQCWIFNNGSGPETVEFLDNLLLTDNRFMYLNRPGASIYEMWNEGLWIAEESDHVAFLNNDIKMHPETLIALNSLLSREDSHWLAYPDYDQPYAFGNFCNYRYTRGTYRHGGMSGYCFMLKTAKITWRPLVDPIFKWWCGDDDIAFEIEKRGGKQVRVVGLPIAHVNEGTARHHDLSAQKAADMKACLEKWRR